ncbi:MAG: hypothetical protein ACOY3P_07610 [Planctomycetota bacterium]
MFRIILGPKAALAAVAALLSVPTDAHAQFVPWNYGWLGNQVFDSSVTAQMQDRAQAQQFAASRNARISQDIRNTLLNEAQMRTAGQVSSQQAARDWWFQTQEQQMARQSAARAMMPPPMAPVVTPIAATEPVGRTVEQPGAIAWPRVLMNGRFAQQRAEIETPFERFAKGGAPVSDAEYDMIVRVSAEMQQGLDQLATEITAADYLSAKQFLDKMAGEARQRIEASSTKTSRT